MTQRPLHLNILSTINENIGDEFIRDGILSLMDGLLTPDGFTYKVYNKHEPWTLLPKGHPAWAMKLVHDVFGRGWRRGFSILSHFPGHCMKTADLVIQSGTPVLWNGAHQSEWANVFWRKFVFRYGQVVPIFNLGAGSCYPWTAPPDKVDEPGRSFYRRMLENTCLTTCRDPLAAKLFGEVSGKPKPNILPCPAFLAGQYHVKPEAHRQQRLLLNVMPMAGHFDFLYQMNHDEWLNIVRSVVDEFRDTYMIEFICHGQTEWDFVQRHWSDMPCHWPATPAEYFHVVKGATAAVVNRLHAAMGLGGLGIPSVAIGTDTRLLMTKQAGIPSLFAPKISAKMLLQETQKMLLEREERSLKLLQLREKTYFAYLDLLSPIIKDLQLKLR